LRRGKAIFDFSIFGTFSLLTVKLFWVSCGEHHHERHEAHEEKQFKHKEQKVENQKKSKTFVYFALFVVNQKIPND